MSVLVPQEESDKLAQERLDNLTIGERINLMISVLKEDFRIVFSKPKKERDIELDPNMFECRWSITADIGWIISREGHEAIREKAFPKQK